MLREVYLEEETPKHKKRNIILVIIFAAIVCIATVAVAVVVALSNPEDQYNRAIEYSKEEKYEEAIDIFAELGNYNDSKKQIEINLHKILESGDFKKAYSIATKLKLEDRDNYQKVADGDLSLLSSHFALTQVNIKTLHKINAREFYKCDTLKQVTISSNITSIGKNAFFDCSNLQSIYLPVSLNHIDENAFKDCTKLIDIYFAGTKKEWKAITKAENWNENTAYYIVHCSDGILQK